ncbi:LGFP repeat-containing protein, partial [Rothia nasimurium]
GIPTTGEIAHNNGQAYEQKFTGKAGQTGAIYWTNWGGTHYVKFTGGIGDFWLTNGNFHAVGVDTPRRYGFPTSPEICSGTNCHQKYEFGVITWSATGGTHGHQAQKCHALNNGRSKYSAQGARQVALALAPRYSAYRNDPVGSHGMFYSCQNTHGMYTLKWSTPAAFGESGFLAPWKRIRDYETGELLPAGVTGNTAGAYSPTGSFSLSTPFGVANPGSGFSDYKTINRNSRWGGDRNTWYYNRYIENGALGYPNENMWNFMTRGDYRQGLMINYNRNLDGSVPSGTAGFAIMLHTIPYSGAAASVAAYQSWGCIAIAPDRMTQFLREGRDADRIIMGVESEVMNW